MKVEERLKEIHKEIQQNISKMIPERYKKVCLYASFSDEEITSGEMFFYYFPNGILKKNPINVYEIAEMFDFDEEQYRKLENRLYESIKKLRQFFIRMRKKPWTNITIIMEGINYIVEYNYDDLRNSEFSSYDRHMVWRYKYLRVPIESYTRREKEVVQRYFESEEYKKTKTIKYQENVYDLQVNRSTIYDSVEYHEAYTRNEKIKEEKNRQKKERIRKEKLEREKAKKEDVKDEKMSSEDEKITEVSGIKNQLLNF